MKKSFFNNITQIRCDGVVEYCYEYNNIRIYGNDTYWGISRWGNNYKEYHGILTNGLLTPRKQASDYMYLLSQNP